MRLHRFEIKEFTDMGICFKTEKEARLFADIIREELEVRIGEALSEHLSEDQLSEFDLCAGNGTGGQWLDENFPLYREVVKQKTKEMEDEILAYKNKIPGVL